MKGGASDEPRVELVYDRDCPNLDEARAMIRQALADVGIERAWTELDREDEQTPSALRRYGSPTVLVNGRDVSAGTSGETLSDGNSCRVYAGDDGCLYGAPSSALIASAIRAQQTAK